MVLFTFSPIAENSLDLLFEYMQNRGGHQGRKPHFGKAAAFDRHVKKWCLQGRSHRRIRGNIIGYAFCMLSVT